MIAVIFEVEPDPDAAPGLPRYGRRAARRAGWRSTASSPSSASSLTDPGKLLSLSFWRDEEAVRALAQPSLASCAGAGRAGGVFRDYRLRVAAVMRDYGCASATGAAGRAAPKHYLSIT
jgi:heme-degrading monooxygenase HmoA